MAPHKMNPEEVFEDRYTNLFLARFGGGAVVVNYKRDRAARDVGFHLRATGSLELSNVRVWFQLKGKHQETWSKSKLQKRDWVPVKVSVDDVKRWYAAPEAVYIVVYLEAIDEFIGEDVRDVVDRRFADFKGDFSSKMEALSQKNMTLRVEMAAVLDEVRISEMLRHRAMRIDGPSWRGRPLGHQFDPLRCELSTLDPDLFVELVEALLTAHDYRIDERIDAGRLLEGVGEGGQQAYLSIGTMHLTYEWLFSMSVEYGTDSGSDFREEGQTFRVQGKTAVLVHSRFATHPQAAGDSKAVLEEIRMRGVKSILLIGNAPEALLLSNRYREVLGDLYDAPQGQGSLAYSILTCPLVFMEFQDRLTWKFVNYLWDDPKRERVKIR